MLAGADVFIGVSAPEPADRRRHRHDGRPGAIVFALANPDPEVDPVAASEHAAVVATGRSDYPNQINNVLAFPGSSAACSTPAPATSPTRCCSPPRPRSPTASTPTSSTPTYIVPSVFDPDVAPAVAAAVRSGGGRHTDAGARPTGTGHGREAADAG